jgi:hypothetical protein
MSWTEGNTPTTVPEGQRRRFIVAERTLTGKFATYELVYLHRYLMPAADGWDPPENQEYDEASDEYVWTGWHEDHCEHCEVTWAFGSPERIVAYMPTPKYEP